MLCLEINWGPYTVPEVARFFSKRQADVRRMVDEDGLPALKLPTKKKSVLKFTLTGLHRWISDHSEGAPLSLEELAQELSLPRTGPPAAETQD